MSKNVLTFTAAGLSLVAAPAFAQEFYLGGMIGSGEVAEDGEGFTSTYDLTSVSSVVGGVRYNIGESVFVGAEAQTSAGTLDAWWADGKTSFDQLEVHLGYQMDSVKFFGFVGTGNSDLEDDVEVESASVGSIYGIGAELAVTNNVSLRVETEITGMTVDDTCDTAIDYDKKVTSVGVIFSF